MTQVRPALLLSSSREPITNGLQPADAPRIDVAELSKALGDAPVLYVPSRATGLVDMLESRSASDIRQALTAFRRRGRYGEFVSLSEKVGVPLALMLGRRSSIPHVLVAHNLTSDKKRSLHKRTGYLHRFAEIIVLCRTQKSYLIDEARVAPERVHFIYDKVDHCFLAPPLIPEQPGSAIGSPAQPILSVGRERRDYETLAAAARLLPHLNFVIVASSPWSRAGDKTTADVPSNVEVRRNLSWPDLRTLYASAAMVVVPLIPGTMYGGGLNGVLEAMAMGKPTIVTLTPGIADYIDDDVTACVIQAGDPAIMAAAIRELTEDRVKAARLGRAARQVIDGGRNLDSYIAALAGIVKNARTNLA